MAVLEKIGNYFGSENERFKERSNILDYERKFIRKKKVKGKWVDWDTRTDAPPDRKAIQSAKNKLLTGSETPGKDRDYRAAEFRSKLQINDLRNPLLAKLRRQFSPKTVDGGRIIDDTRDQKEAAIREQLAIQSGGTSYDQFLDPSSPSYKDGGEEVGTMVNGELQPTGDYSTGTGVVETPQGDSIDLTQTTNTPKEQTEVQKPFINQVSSDVKPNRTALKSDVFTLDKDGKPLGVMTRGQRRRWEAANQDTMAANIKKLKISYRTYANRVGSG